MVADLLAFIFAERCLGWAGGLVLVSKPKDFGDFEEGR